MSLIMVILDGWGESDRREGNGIRLAEPHEWQKLLEQECNVLLRTDGHYVGLPDGQTGNSEVGHMTIGAGRVIEQDLPRINRAIVENRFAETWQSNVASVKNNGRNRLHMVGLVSSGGVHGDIRHWVAMTEKVLESGLEPVWHMMLDGRDTPRGSAVDEWKELRDYFGKKIVVATIMGRFYGMDRDNRTERTRVAYRAIMYGKGLPIVGDWYEGLCHLAEEQHWGANGGSEEMLEPRVVLGYRGCGEGDGLLSMNFRSDRIRQILRALIWGMGEDWFSTPWSTMIGMVPYADDLSSKMVALCPKPKIPMPLGKVVSTSGLKQFRVAETEKYAHVTYFLNGGEEKVLEGEAREMIASPKVDSYDTSPHMSAEEITSTVLQAMRTGYYDFLVVNYANPDMIGHTGNLAAVVQGVQFVDTCLSRIVGAAKSLGLDLLVLADHGNAEEMLHPQTGKISTSHSLNPVRMICVGNDIVLASSKQENFGLADVAPTVLSLLALPIPQEMTGTPVFVRSSDIPQKK